MQKKILLSLLMTAPAGLAFASVTLDNGGPSIAGWETSGMSSQDVLNVTDEKVVAQIANGQLSQQIKLPYYGKYNLTFEDATNLSITIKKADGTVLLEEAPLNGPNVSVTFNNEVVGEQEVTVILKGIDTALNFSYTGCALELDFDFETEYTLLNGKMPDLSTRLSLDKGNDDEAVKALIDKFDTNLLAIQDKLAKLNGEVGKDKLDLYNAEELWKDLGSTPDSKLYNAIVALGTEFEALQDAIKASNFTYENNQAKNALVTGAGELEKNLKTVADTLDAQKDTEAHPGYVDLSEIAKGIAAVQTLIDTYKEEIDAQYAEDLLSEGTITFKPVKTQAEIQAEIDALSAALAADKADYDAWNNVYGPKGSLEVLKNTTLKTLKEDLYTIKGVEGQEGVYGNMITTWSGELEAIVAKAEADLNTAMPAKAPTADSSAQAEAAKTVVEAATASLNAEVQGYKNFEKAQNTAYEEATATISGLQEAFDNATKGVEAPEGKVAEYDAKVKSIADAIDALTKKVNSDYTGDTHVVGDYKADVPAKDGKEELKGYDTVQAEIDNLEKYVAGFEPISELQKKLDEAKKAVEGMLPGTDVKVEKPFKSTIDNIQAAIDALQIDKNGEINEQQETDIKNNIADIEPTVTALKANFQTIQDNITAISNSIKGIDTYFSTEGKIVIPASEYAARIEALKNSADYKALGADSEKLAADRNAAAALEGQQCFDAAKKLAADSNAGFEEEDGVKVYKKAIELKDKVSGEWTADNYTNTDAALKTLDKLIANNGEDFSAKAKAEVEAATLKASLEAIKAELDALADNEKVAANYDAEDEKLLDVYNGYLNLDAYVDLVISCDGAATELDAVKAFNEEDSVEPADKDAPTPAQEYYKKELKKKQTNLDEIKTKIENAYNPGIDGKNAGDMQVTIQGEIDTFKSSVSALKTIIENNNDAYVAQVTRKASLTTEVSNLATRLESDEIDRTLPEVEQWVEDTAALNGLLVKVTSDITAANKAGKSAGTDESKNISDQLDAIKAEVDRINGEINDKYPEIVSSHNNKIAEDNGWGTNPPVSMKTELDAQYKESVDVMNLFYYGINNEGYKVFVQNEIKSNLAIFDYAQKILDLESEISKYIAEQNKVEKTITDAEFKAKLAELQKNAAFTGDAQNSYVKQMRSLAEDAVVKANAAAEAYWNQKKARVDALKNGALADLAAAGLETAQDTAAKKALDKVPAEAEEAYDATVKTFTPVAGAALDIKELEKLIGYQMDAIATTLDKYSPQFVATTLQTYAKASWNAIYPTNAWLSAQKEAITTCALVPVVANTNAIEFDRIVEEELKPLGERVSQTNPLIGEYYTDAASLRGIIESLENLVKATTDANDAQVAEKEALAGYQQDAADLEAALDELNKFIAGFAEARKVDTAGIQAEIDSFKADVEFYTGRLAQDSCKSYLDALVVAITDKIEGAKGEICALEGEYVNTLINAIKEAFNNAKAAGAAGFDEAVYLKKIEELKNARPKIEGEKYDEYKAAVIPYETQLCDLLVELQNLMKDVADMPNDLQDAVSALTVVYDNATKEIAAGKAAAGSYLDNVKATYEPQYDALRSKLDAVKAAWEAAGNAVIAQQGNFSQQIEDIETELAALNAKAAAAESHAQTVKESNEAFETLSAQLAEIQTTLDGYAATLTEYAGNAAQEGQTAEEVLAGGGYIYIGHTYLEWIEELNFQIEEAQFRLTEANTLAGLTAQSKITFNLFHHEDEWWSYYEYSDLSEEQFEGIMGNFALEATRTFTENVMFRSYSMVHNMILNLSRRNIMTDDVVADVKNEILAELHADQKTLNGFYDKFSGEDVTKPETLLDYADIQRIYADAFAIGEKKTAWDEQIADNTFRPGRVTGDLKGNPTVVDVQQLIQWVLDETSLDELSPIVASAANLSAFINPGEIESVIDIADVTIDIDLALGKNPQEVLARRMLKVADMGSDSFGLTLVSEENGVKRYALTVSNTADLVAGQFDITSAGNTEILGVSAADRLNGHEVFSSSNSFGTTRVVIASLDNNVIDGHNGALVFIDVTGDGELSIHDVKFADRRANTYMLDWNEESGVNTIVDSVIEAGKRIYNTAGQALGKLRKGINIVVHGDGKVTKEMNRK